MRQRPFGQLAGLAVMESPIGWLAVTAFAGRLVEVRFLPERAELEESLQRDYPGFVDTEAELLRRAIRQLQDYFSGRRRSFELPLNLDGMSLFAGRCLAALAHVEFGETVTYGELARRTGYPRAARAIGRVMAGNPLPIVLPCHRVVGAGGVLTGYSGGSGLVTKDWLLQFEQRHLSRA